MKYLVIRNGCNDVEFKGPEAAGAARLFALTVKAEGVPGAIVSRSLNGFDSTVDTWDGAARH